MISASAKRPTILFFAEAVTLAHIGRPIVLGNGLDGAVYDRILACDERYRRFFPETGWRCEPIHSIDSRQFTDSLAKGRPVYSLDTLRGYVREDLSLIERIAPALIVGDFRLSLSVSARLAKIPYFAISNAYWSPYARPRFVIPSHPLVSVFGPAISDVLFRLARPGVFALHSLPMNRLRRENGLPTLGWDLPHAYTDADITLYADAPEMVPVVGLPQNHRYLGPVSWSPEVPMPPGLDASGSAFVYVTLGSSGQADLLPAVLDALSTLPCRVLASSAGAPPPQRSPANAFVADFLPGNIAASRSALVVCNGGSPTTQQALLAGTPVLGIADNLDQFLNMGYIEKSGVGRLVRRDQATVESIRTVAQQMLTEPAYRSAARKLADEINTHDAPAAFAKIVAEVLD